MTTPYREGKPLTEVIAPDRRRQTAIMIAIAGMVVGAIAIEALRGAFSEPRYAQPTIPDPPPTVSPDGVLPGRITPAEVSAVVASHSAALRDACFSRRTTVQTADVDVDFDLGTNGQVVRVTTRGTDSGVNSCVDHEIRQWQFPAHAEESPGAHVPFHFERT